MSCKSLSTLTVGLFAILFCITVTTNAQEATHEVKKGETLFSIAQQYDISVQQLREWNNLEENNLSVGETIVINKVSDEDAITHTVEPQETLFSISKQYNVRIAELKEWNNLSTNNVEVGQELTIYPSKSTEQTKQSIVVNNETESNSYYVVKSSDTLFRIAQQHGMTVDELKELNDLSSNALRVGQRLTVRGNSSPPSVAKSIESSPQGKFVSYEVSTESISLQELLKKFQMSEEEFRALNPNINGSTFRSGRELNVLAPPSKKYKNPYLASGNMQDLGSARVSQYSSSEKAKPTTSGELYNPNALTAAHSNISLGSVIYVENPENNKGTYVRINDRNSGNGLKLSSAAWQLLDFNSSSPKVSIFQNQ
jgi:LysM repeat protein